MEYRDENSPMAPQLMNVAPMSIRPENAFASPSIPALHGMEEKEEIREYSNAVEEAIEDIEDRRIDTLGRKMLEEFNLAKSARMLQERLWIRLHQNEKGIYAADFNFSGGTCKAFVQLTRPKVMNAHARLVDVLLPAGEDAWDVTPTPKPFIPELLIRLLASGADNETITKQMQEAGAKAAKAMKLKVKDGLSETNWPLKMQEALLYMVLYGTGIVFGPYAVPAESNYTEARRGLQAKFKSRLDAIMQANGVDWSQFEDEFRPEMDVYSPFFVYPDPGAPTVEECRFIIIKKPINKSALMDLANTKQEGFRLEAIREVIDQHPNGDWTPEWWESQLNATNLQSQMNAPNDKFQLYIRWGWVSGRDLERAGISVGRDQLNQQVVCQMWVVSGRVIFLQPSDLYRDRLPFYFIPYSTVPHTIWGAGPAEFMMDSQDGINALERLKFDNIALAGRPMAAVNVDRLAAGQDALELTPGRIFATINSQTGDSHKPVEWFMPPTILAQIQQAQQATMQLADEQTNLPRNLMGMGGEGVHNRTAQGASLQFNNAITPLKGVAFNVDVRLVSPMIQNMVNFYTKFSKDPSIVGDFKVVASGVTGLMAREVASQKAQALLLAMAQNQDLARRVDPKAIAEIIMRGSGLYDQPIVFTEQEVAERERQAQEEAQVNQAASTQLQSQIQTNAQLQMAQGQAKLRAETSPRDVLLQALQGVPEDAKMLRLEIIKAVLDNTGLLNPDLENTLIYEMQKESLVTQDQIKALASNEVTRELGPMEIRKMQHAEKLAKIKSEEVRNRGTQQAEY